MNNLNQIHLGPQKIEVEGSGATPSKQQKVEQVMKGLHHQLKIFESLSLSEKFFLNLKIIIIKDLKKVIESFTKQQDGYNPFLETFLAQYVDKLYLNVIRFLATQTEDAKQKAFLEEFQV